MFIAQVGETEGPTEAEVKDLQAKIGRLAVENDVPMASHGPNGATIPSPISERLKQ